MRPMSGNKGSFLENLITNVNNYYDVKNIARIDKISVPTSLNKGQMVFVGKSTVDYTGLLSNGIFIGFDAKQSKDNRFPMGNIKEHQVLYLHKVNELKGIGFFLILMTKFNRLFIVIVTNEWIDKFWKTRHGMDINDLQEYGIEVLNWQDKYPVCDYLKFVINYFNQYRIKK